MTSRSGRSRCRQRAREILGPLCTATVPASTQRHPTAANSSRDVPRRRPLRYAFDIGGPEIVSTITKTSADRLKLKAGDTVLAVIKASDVMVGK